MLNRVTPLITTEGKIANTLVKDQEKTTITVVVVNDSKPLYSLMESSINFNERIEIISEKMLKKGQSNCFTRELAVK